MQKIGFLGHRIELNNAYLLYSLDEWHATASRETRDSIGAVRPCHSRAYLICKLHSPVIVTCKTRLELIVINIQIALKCNDLGATIARVCYCGSVDADPAMIKDYKVSNLPIRFVRKQLVLHSF